MRSMGDVRAGGRTGSIRMQAATEPLLERSAQLAALASDLNSAAATGCGRLVLIGGEAGIGKSALVDVFCASVAFPVLTGACEALHTPRPLGPLVDIADQVGGELAELVEAGVTPSN